MQDNFLLVASFDKGIFQIDLSTGTTWAVPLSSLRRTRSVAYDPMDSKIYWLYLASQDQFHLMRSNLNGTDEEVASIRFFWGMFPFGIKRFCNEQCALLCGYTFINQCTLTDRCCWITTVYVFSTPLSYIRSSSDMFNGKLVVLLSVVLLVLLLPSPSC